MLLYKLSDELLLSKTAVYTAYLSYLIQELNINNCVRNPLTAFLISNL